MVRLYQRFGPKSADTMGPSTDLYVPTVMSRIICLTHNAPLGIPCFHVPRKDENGYHGGICNNRAILAGFNNPIREKSLDWSSPRPDKKQY